MPLTRRRRSAHAGTSLGVLVSRRARLGLGLLALLVVLVLASGVMTAVEGIRAVALRDREVAAADLLAGMADQQTGLLTYLKPAQPDSLLLYTRGQQETQTSLAALRAVTTGTADAEAEARMESSVRAWQRWADELRASSLASGLPVADPAVTAEGRRLFGVFLSDHQLLVSSLEAESQDAAGDIRAWTTASIILAIGGSLVVTLFLARFAMQIVGRVLAPLRALAEAAEEIAVQGRTSLPHQRRADEVGDLARALERWQDASAVRTILIEQAPVGICRLDSEGRFLMTNAAFEAMLGYTRGEMVGRPLRTFLYPGDRTAAAADRGHQHGDEAHDRQTESLWLCRDGSAIWVSMVRAPVLGIEGEPETLIGIMEDITERKRQAERAAQIQRDLLPSERPTVEGYELAGACLAAQEVGGDFYDWVGPGPEGHLDLTVADVMGKGVGAALVMATLRAALRSAPAELGPAARARLAAGSMSRGLTDEGLFVTLFHARLEVGTGRLRYVDAGHGHWLVRRADGTVVTLGERSLPLGVGDGEYAEGQVELGPGDTLLVYTDGLVEAGDETLGPGELAGELVGLEDAEEMVERLVDRVRGQQQDDVTVVVLRRLPETPVMDGAETAGHALLMASS